MEILRKIKKKMRRVVGNQFKTMWRDRVVSELDVQFVKDISKAKRGVIATISNCVTTRKEHWEDDIFQEIYMSDRPDTVPWGSSQRLCVTGESQVIPYHITDEAHLNVSKSIFPRTHIFTQITEKDDNFYVTCFLNGMHSEMILRSNAFQNWLHSPWVSIVYS
jgi:hypothetical protein